MRDHHCLVPDCQLKAGKEFFIAEWIYGFWAVADSTGSATMYADQALKFQSKEDCLAWLAVQPWAQGRVRPAHFTAAAWLGK